MLGNKQTRLRDITRPDPRDQHTMAIDLPLVITHGLIGQKHQLRDAVAYAPECVHEHDSDAFDQRIAGGAQHSVMELAVERVYWLAGFPSFVHLQEQPFKVVKRTLVGADYAQLEHSQVEHRARFQDVDIAHLLEIQPKCQLVEHADLRGIANKRAAALLDVD